jgi:hypothetical protein
VSRGSITLGEVADRMKIAQVTQPGCCGAPGPDVSVPTAPARRVVSETIRDVGSSPACNCVTSLTRHTSFATGSHSFREPNAYRSRNKPQVCMLPIEFCP